MIQEQLFDIRDALPKISEAVNTIATINEKYIKQQIQQEETKTTD